MTRDALSGGLSVFREDSEDCEDSLSTLQDIIYLSFSSL